MKKREASTLEVLWFVTYFLGWFLSFSLPISCWTDALIHAPPNSSQAVSYTYLAQDSDIQTIFFSPIRNLFSLSMADMKVISWNVKGLCSPMKCMKVLHHLKRLRADIALLQETYLAEADFFWPKKLWVEEVVGYPAVSCKAGEIILLHKNLPRTIKSVARDDLGRKVSLDLHFSSRTIQIINIYSKNKERLRLEKEKTSCGYKCGPPK